MHDLRQTIKEWERLSQALEPDAAERQQWRGAANEELDRFLDGLGQRQTFRAFSEDAWHAISERLETADDPRALLSALITGLADLGLLTAGPGHLGFVPGGGLFSGALADFIAATVNPFSADAFASPLAVRLHKDVINWLVSIMGLGPQAWGDVTSGGSHATLTALHVARFARGIKPKDYHRVCVYLSSHTHHCCQKALTILFADAVCLREVPLRDQRMDAGALDRMIREDQEAGLLPSFIIATAGTTNLGCVDPLQEIASLAQRHGLWLHVDAACGGFFKLCAATQSLFQGIEQADSIVLDPHKGMFLPYGCGAVLFQNGDLLRQSFGHSGAYLQDRSGELDRSPMDYSMELTRPFRSLRLWLALKLHGAEAFKAALEEKLLLARYCRQRLREIPGIEVLGPMDLSILAFRYVPPQQPELALEATQRMLQSLHQDGSVFLSSTRIEGIFVIRIAILSFRTHLETIDALVAWIKQEAAKLTDSLAAGGSAC